MSKDSKSGSNTDGKGKLDEEKKKGILAKIASLFDDDSDDTADPDETDTSTETEGDAADDADEELDEVADKAAESGTADDSTGDSAEVEEDKDDDPLPGDTGEKKFTQTDLSKIVQERLSKQEKKLKTSFGKEKEELVKKAESLQKRLDSYLTSDKTAVQTALDALPEAIRKTSPASKLDTPKQIAQVKRWLPKAQELASTLTGKPGNSGGFRPLETKKDGADDDVVAKAANHSIYRGGF